jgi:hypothetical protein
MGRELLPRLLTVAALAGAIVACSLLVDTSEISEGCGSGMKDCNQRCVSMNEPAYGCSDGCTPCGGENVIHRCADGGCVFVTCVHGFGCPNCSANLFADPLNCGTCGNVCDGGTCADGVCIPEGGALEAGAGGAGGEGSNAP